MAPALAARTAENGLWGAFKGQAVAIGPCLFYDGKIGNHPIGMNLRYYQNLTATNVWRDSPSSLP